MQPIGNNIPIMNQPTFSGTKNVKSLLILISPRKYYEIALRPIQYNFHVGVVETVVSQLQKSESSLINKDLHRQIANESLMPAPTPMLFDVANEYWSFCFRISHGSIYNHLQLAPVASIIIGYCTDEPVFYQNGKQVYNPRCRLIPTHMLQITTLTQAIGQSGIEVNKVTSSTDIVNYLEDVVRQINPNTQQFNNPLYINTPDVMVKMIDREGNINPAGSDMGTIMVTPPPESLQDQVSAKINSNANKPVEHIKAIMNAISSAALDTGGEFEMMPYVLKDRVADSLNTMALSKPVSTLAVSGITDQLYMEYIVTNFDPEIVVTQIPRHQMLDVIDPTITTPNTVYSNLLAQLIPLYMIKYNLSYVAFSYDSFTGQFNPETMHIEFFTTETPEVMKQKVDRFLMELKLDVLEIPKKYGDFVLNVAINFIGNIFVDLRFYDIPYPSGYFAQDTVFRPYGETAIADFDTIANNAGNLDSLISNLTPLVSGSI